MGRGGIIVAVVQSIMVACGVWPPSRRGPLSHSKQSSPGMTEEENDDDEDDEDDDDD